MLHRSSSDDAAGQTQAIDTQFHQRSSRHEDEAETQRTLPRLRLAHLVDVAGAGGDVSYRLLQQRKRQHLTELTP